jgi:hypothetical protein
MPEGSEKVLWRTVHGLTSVMGRPCFGSAAGQGAIATLAGMDELGCGLLSSRWFWSAGAASAVVWGLLLALVCAL